MPVFGTFAVIASLTVTLIGLPHQIYKNYRKKSCAGLAPSLIYAAFFSYMLWGLYGWTKPDVFLITAQTPGFVLSSIILGQLFYYRNPKAH